jgi:nucleoside-diphosphate-sugar epimerase
MKVLLTGATGFVGGHLRPALSAAGHHLRLFARSAKNVDFDQGGGCSAQIVEGDLTQPETLEPAVRGMDAVVHCAALMSDKEYSPWGDFVRHNVEGTRSLLEACRRTGRPLFIHISTTMVVGSCRNEKILREDSPLNPGPSRYVRSKALSEQAVRACADLPWAILRLPPLYGPRMRYGWPEILRRIRQEKFRLIGDGLSRMHLTHIQDVVEGIVLALKNPQALHGRTYQLAGPRPAVLGDIFSLLARELGAAAPRRLPYGAVLAAAYLLQAVPPRLKSQALKLLLPHRVRYFAEDYVYDTTAARRDFGFNPKIDPADGMRRLAAEFMREGVAQ